MDDPRVPDRNITVFNDAMAALAAGTGGELRGVALISGTGSIAVGAGHNGVRVRAGGWGPLVSDDGSGFSIGSAALRVAAASSDGRQRPPSALLGAICEQLGLQCGEEVSLN